MQGEPDNGDGSATSDNELCDDGCLSSDATGSERIEILEKRFRKMNGMSVLFFVMFCAAVVTAFFYFAPQHSHYYDYADSHHSHDYADSYHSHRYAEEDHRHYNYAEDGHIHDWEHWH